MAVRVPLRMFQDGNSDWQIREMTQSEIDAVIVRIASKYGNDPAITLTTDNGNVGQRSGIAYNISGYGNTLSSADYNVEIHVDFRNEYYTTGTAATSVSSYPSESTTGEPELQLTRYYDYPTNPSPLQAPLYSFDGGTNYATDTDNKRFPLFYNNGNLQCMSITDVLDTFVYPAYDYIAGVSSIAGMPAAEDQPGNYKIIGKSGVKGDGGEGVAPANPTNYTRRGTVPVFKDRFSDQTKYTDGTAAGTIGTSGTTQDYYEYVEYWLFQRDHDGTFSAFADGGNAKPLIIKPGTDPEDLQIQDDIDDIVNLLTHYAHGEGASGTRRLTYKIVDATSTSLDILGSIMNNSTTNATGIAGTVKTRFVNGDDYRSQEFPIGTISVRDQYALVLDPNDTVA